jgi:hypothetical protein
LTFEKDIHLLAPWFTTNKKIKNKETLTMACVVPCSVFQMDGLSWKEIRKERKFCLTSGKSLKD